MSGTGFKHRWMILLAILPCVGCATMQDAHYEHTQHLRTERAWLHFWWCSDEAMSFDYKCGWKAGYLAVLMGDNGTPPMVPPHRYWRPSATVRDCDEGRQEWYVGYQDGAMLASLEPDTHYIKLYNPPVCQSGPAYEAQVSAMSAPAGAGPPMAPASERPTLAPVPSETDPMPERQVPPPASDLPPIPNGQ